MSVIDAIIAKKLCGGGGSSVPKPLTYDYMPEGYPKKSVQTTTLMALFEVPFNPVSAGTSYRAKLPDPLVFEIVVGQTYTVNWDGTEYECVCVSFDENTYIIGNLSITFGILYCYNRKHSKNRFTIRKTSKLH